MTKTQLGILNNTSVTTREWTLRQNYYHKIPNYCMTNIIFDKKDPDKMSHVGCNRLSCPRCRPKLKDKLIDRLIDVAESRSLTRELILTCPGKSWRKTHTPEYSFKWLNKKFHTFKILYERTTGKKLEYIKLPRSQLSGYCHHHILINQYITHAVIEDLISRIGIGTNYKIKYYDKHRLRQYLKNDFKKDHEWFIPIGSRHVSSSMEFFDDNFRKSIFIMWLPGSDDYCVVTFGKYVPPNKRYDFVFDVVQNYADRPPPYWYFQECFTDMQHLLDRNDYIANMKKYFMELTCKLKGGFNGKYQMDLHGRLYKITTEFIQPTFTTQKKFRRTV